MSDTPGLLFFSDIIEKHAQELADKPYILFEDDVITFKDFNLATRRAANAFTALGAKEGDGVALLMGNCPEYLYLFHGAPRIGMYNVPVNVSLKGDGLKHILSHSDVKYLMVDDTYYPNVAELGTPLGSIEKVIVQRTAGGELPVGTIDLQDFLDAPDDKPDHAQENGCMLTLLYTSGTTGLPKGVVNRNRPTMADGMKAYILTNVDPDKDIFYTALPLFHANALHLTAGFAMYGGVTFGLDRRFSASRFWDRTRHYNATVFNALGAMIPILMKQPEKPNDGDNPIVNVNSAACPANLWEEFEKRFKIKIYEGYGAVDGAGVTMGNRGDAPVGSVGQPAPGVEWKLVDDDENEVPQGEPGELIVKVVDKDTQKVEYYKNPDASADKTRGGWIRSGDMFYADKDRNLFFVDRKTDSMRRRGENISSWEVENAVEKFPAIAECGAFGTPSDLGEDEVMIWIKLKEGQTLDHEALTHHCIEHMAYFMVPRYIDVVDDIPRTGTHRVQKGSMKKRGVTERTWDREEEMPDLVLKRTT